MYFDHHAVSAVSGWNNFVYPNMTFKPYEQHVISLSSCSYKLCLLSVRNGDTVQSPHSHSVKNTF